MANRVRRIRPHEKQAVACKFCGHHYIDPCDLEQSKKCGNVKPTEQVKRKKK